MPSEKSLAQIRAELEAAVDAYNAAVKANDMKAAAHSEQMLKESEDEYLSEMQWQVFCALKQTDKPIVEAVRKYSFTILKHRTVKVDGVVTGVELVERERQIDLVKFCKHCEFDVTWQYKVEKFGQLLTMRAAKELNMTPAEVKAIASTYYMSELSRKEKLGETPMSNTQIVRVLQSVIDAFLFEAGENGANIYKVNNHDVAYLLMCYTKRGRGLLTVQVAKTGFVHSLILDVCHRIVTGKVYGVEYKMAKEKDNGLKPAEKKPAKAKSAKAEPEAVEPDTIEVPLPEKKPA